MKVLYTGKMRNGTPIPDLIKMVHYNHPEVEFIPYSPTEKGDVILGINMTMAEDSRSIRKVMYLGSVPSFLKSNKREETGSVDHTIFISDYCKNIFLNRWSFKKYSVFLPFGPMPADNNLEPIIGKRIIDGHIKFVAVAKWHKRAYKRQHQIIRLYQKYLSQEYPDSTLHLLGCGRDLIEDGVHYYQKCFWSDWVVDFIKGCHIHLIPTPFDTGPKTIPESMHYRVPFVCSNNCAGIEYIDKVGKCGIEVATDPIISSWAEYKAADPLNYRSTYVRNKIPYD